jgi:hypothetical protein
MENSGLFSSALFLLSEAHAHGRQEGVNLLVQMVKDAVFIQAQHDMLKQEQKWISQGIYLFISHFLSVQSLNVLLR